MSEAKLKRALRLLLLKHGRLPGVKGYVLKRHLGKKYEDVLKKLDELLEKFGLRVVKVEEGEGPLTARYFVALREPLKKGEERACGWRIDELAGLAVLLSYMSVKGGKMPINDAVSTLASKFGEVKARILLDKYVREGYLEVEGDVVYLGWRTKAEVSLEELRRQLVLYRPKES